MSLMSSRNPYKLAVTLASVEPFYPTLRRWRYEEDFDGGFKYLVAEPKSEDENFQTQSDYNFNEVATRLRGLVEPIRLMTTEERAKEGLSEESGAGIRDDLEPDEVLSFVNEFGQIGFADYFRLGSLQRPFTLDRGELTPDQAMTILGIKERFRGAITEFYRKEPKSYRKWVGKLQSGEIIPFKWVEQDLLDLARCVRILLALDKNYLDGDTYLTLPSQNSRRRRRFLVASELVFVPYRRDEMYREGKDFWLVEDRHIQGAWNKFSYNLNRFLTPITFNAVTNPATVERRRARIGVETWLIYEILTSRANLLDRRCARKECRIQFIGERSTRRYCSDTCSAIVRNKAKRERDKKKKKSSGTSQKKAQAKGKKKNG